MGSKARIKKDILPVILQHRKNHKQWYVEPFTGGMNVICDVPGNRIANDINPYLISMFKACLDGWKPCYITEEQYKHIRDNKDNYRPELVGWAGFCCSFGSKFFGGYVGGVRLIKRGDGSFGKRDDQKNSYINLSRQLDKLRGVVILNNDYKELFIPPKSIIYCDPPYKGTTGYKVDFNHVEFWEWVRVKTLEGHHVYTSEYDAPPDFKCIWEKELISSLRFDGTKSTEKLFVYNP